MGRTLLLVRLSFVQRQPTLVVILAGFLVVRRCRVTLCCRCVNSNEYLDWRLSLHESFSCLCMDACNCRTIEIKIFEQRSILHYSKSFRLFKLHALLFLRDNLLPKFLNALQPYHWCHQWSRQLLELSVFCCCCLNLR